MNIQNVIAMFGSKGIEASVDTVNKNGVDREALLVGGDDVKMVFYTDIFSVFSDSDIIEEICKQLKQNKLPEIDGTLFTDWNKAKTKVLAGIRPKSSDTKIAKTPFHEFEIYAYIPVGGGGIAKVTNRMCCRYGIYVEDDLMEAAYTNTAATLTLQTLDDVLSEFGYGVKGSGMPSMVLTNKDKVLGAIGLWYDDLLYMACSKLDTDQILIIPSSVHELIILRRDDVPIDTLNQTIREINRSIVDPKEVLGDNAYIYDKVRKELYIAEE